MICDDVQHPYYVVRKSVFLRPHLTMYILQDVRWIIIRPEGSIWTF